uniref:Uncharacterized protein n=1 Tax=Octopus bimaculoides TaxID=37653 RepID=A0A0L8GR57_OCTBM
MVSLGYLFLSCKEDIIKTTFVHSGYSNDISGLTLNHSISLKGLKWFKILHTSEYAKRYN